MKIENFKPATNKSWICTFDIMFPNMGYGIREFRLMETQGKRWVSVPSREYTDPEGKKKYYNFISFDSPERKKAFEAKCMELLAPFLNAVPPTELPF